MSAIEPVSIERLPASKESQLALLQPQAAAARKNNRLVDSFGRAHTYLRISVTDRCNLRCSYCMPPEGIEWKAPESLLTFEEILRVARVFADMGIDKIRMTGGEPLTRNNLPDLIAQLAAIPGINTLAMTTNGVLLKEQANGLRQAGLNALNISLDTLRPERFIQIAKRDYFKAVMEGIQAALKAGFDVLKLNVVIMAGVNEDEILDFVELIRDQPMNVRFIEYMPFKNNAWHQAAMFPFADMKHLIESHYRLNPIQPEFGDVAKNFSLAGYPGTVSFITSMTDSFCGTCNRLRLTADGQIKSCLFHPAEINIRDALRQNASNLDLERLIQSAVQQKQKAHSPMSELLHMENRAMIEIGG